MSKRGPTTFAKRQREMDKKRKADQKRQERAQRRKEGPQELEIMPLRPITDDEPNPGAGATPNSNG